MDDKFCVLCGQDLETNWNLFVNCSFVWECWQKAAMSAPLEMEIQNCEGFADLVFRCLDVGALM